MPINGTLGVHWIFILPICAVSTSSQRLGALIALIRMTELPSRQGTSLGNAFDALDRLVEVILGDVPCLEDDGRMPGLMELELYCGLVYIYLAV